MRVRVRVMNIAAVRARAGIVIRVVRRVRIAVRRMRLVVAVKPAPRLVVVVVETIRGRHQAKRQPQHLSYVQWNIPHRRRSPTRVIVRNNS